MFVMPRIKDENVSVLLTSNLGDHEPSAIGSRCSASIGTLGFLASHKS